MNKIIYGLMMGVFIYLFVPQNSIGRIVRQTLYINQGTFIAVNATTFPALAFNRTSRFERNSLAIRLSPKDQLILTITNRDDIPHNFKIKSVVSDIGTILPSQTKVDTIEFAKVGVYIYYDDLNYPNNSYVGLSGFISVFPEANAKSYYWNLKEHQSQFHNLINVNKPVSWNAYDPDFFTINGNSYPQLMDDTTARIQCYVGDTINIFIANTGQSSHALHFHGFHLKILHSSISETQKGWIKDSFPIKSMKGMILQMVPDKKGEYSVHDHNLIAMSGALMHPFGMVMIMLIE